MNYRNLMALMLSLSIGTAFGFVGSYNRTLLPEVDTQGNTVGIEEGDVCRYNSREKTVICQSGLSFKGVGSADRHAGTRATKYKNYIGAVKTRADKPGRTGSGLYLDICADGSCIAE